MDKGQNSVDNPPSNSMGDSVVPENRQALFTPQPPEATANTDSLTDQSQTAVNLSHPYFSNHPTQTFNTDTGDIILNSGEPKPKQNKRPFIIGGIILAVVVVVCMVVLLVVSKIGNNKKVEFSTGIGKMNTAIIFDETAPIPINIDGNYGYISPDDGSQMIGARFLEAERFYGEYAIVKVGSMDNVSETLIINRSGETIFTFDGDNTATYYDAENNYWMIDGDIYNIKMQKVTPNNTIGQYIGNGYLLIMSNMENGEQSGPAISDDSQTEDAYLSQSAYIANLNGDKLYECKNYCSAFTLKIGDVIYAAVRVWGMYSQIIDLSSGKVIYTTTQNKIYLQDQELVERSDKTVKYLKIQDGIVTDSVRPITTPVLTVSGAGQYVVESCKDSTYTIKTIDGGIVTECSIDDYYELPLSLYEAYQDNYKQTPILVVRNEKIELLNMDTAQAIRIYDGRDIRLFDDSPFLYYQSNDGENQICNLLAGSKEDDINCIKFRSETELIEGYSNYFVIEDSGKEHIYNSAIKEIR